MFYSVLIVKESQPQFAFTFEGTQYTFMWMSLGYLNSPAIAHNLCQQDLDALTVCPCTIWHSIDDILI